MTEPTSLYRHFEANGALLYVGISCQVLVRTSEHANGAVWFQQIKTIIIEHFSTRKLALVAEKAAILKEKPLYNRTYPKGREGRRFIAAYALSEMAHQFKLLALQQKRTVQSLLVEAINDLFAKYRMSRIADEGNL